MSDTITLQADAREASGTRAARRLRKAGKIPAVVYGHGEGTASIALDAKAVGDSLKHGAHLFNLDLAGGKTETVLIKDVAFDVYGERVLHMDLTRISLDERITTLVPVEMVGEAPGTLEGGVVSQKYSELEVECRADQIPDRILADIGALGMGDNLNISDLKLPEGVNATAEGDYVVVHIAPPRVVEDDEDEQAATEDTGAEPEVIGEKDDDAEGEAPAEDA